MKRQESKLRALNKRSILIATILAILLWALPNAGKGLTSANPIIPPLQNGTFCGPMDVTFIIDHSGSMSDAIDNVKSQLTGILDDIETASGNDFRLALVSFGFTINVRQTFTGNRATFETALTNLSIGDFQGRECSDEALDTVINARLANDPAIPLGRQIGDFTPGFRPGVLRIAIVVTDVTPGRFTNTFVPDPQHIDPNSAESHAHHLAVQAAGAGIKISAVYVNTDNIERDDAIRVMMDYATTTDSFFIEDTTNGNMTGDAITQIIAGCATPCSITCPSDIVTLNDPNECGAVVTYPPPTTTGDCTVTCSPASGSFFVVGTTTVTCSDAGSQSCSFTITVKDTQPPQITCPASITVPSNTNQCTGIANFTTTASDNCPGVTEACNPPSGSTFAVGTTTVTCTATDGSGNTATCGFTVKVVDNIPPVIVCPQQSISVQCAGVTNYSIPSAIDNCSVASVVCSPPPNSAFPVGQTTVTCIARDETGNERACSFSVTVQNTQPPVIHCQGDPPAGSASGSACQASVTFTRPTATDSCGNNVPVRGVRLDTGQEVSGTSGSFPVGVTTIQWSAGNGSAQCVTNITVSGQTSVTVPSEINFGAIDFEIAKKKKPKKRFVSLADSTRTFTIRNDGCGNIALTLKSINRIGEDVANGKITNTDDSDFFSIREIGGGLKSPKGDNTILIPANTQKKDFEITFQPKLPERSTSNNGLSTKQALPDPFTSEMVLMDAAGATFKIALKADLSNEVHFINPDDIQKKAPVVNFSKSGDVFTVDYTLYDSDTGGKQANSASFVKSAKYEFLDSGGGVVGTVDVDLAGPIETANLAKGQRFKVTKTFSGADDNSSVSRVRVTVTDGTASTSLEANLSSGAAAQTFVSAQGFTYGRDVTIYLPGDRLEGFKR